MKYIIIGYTEKGVIRKKLLTLGLTPNTIIEVIRTAPLGDPIEIKVRGFMLSIRKTEYDILILKSMECPSCTKCG
jgi:ferrous iron transport protein A